MAQSATLPPLVRGEWLPMTHEEFLAWSPEGVRTEWTDGEGIAYASNSDRHQWLIALFANLLTGFAELYGLGRVVTAPYPAVLWPGGPHREPDVMFVARDRLDRWTHQRFHGAPDFAFEALSEDTAAEDRGRKRRDLEAAGTAEYLMMDARPNRFDFVFLRLDGAGRYEDVEPGDQGRYHLAVLPGFWLDPAWFRQDPLPDYQDLLSAIAGRAYDEWLAAKRRAWLATQSGE
jgi:Uma2 family endonuclease